MKQGQDQPNQVWVGDITYIGTDEGWLYLAVVLDLYSRRVVGWSMGERMPATLVCDALRMALFQRKMPRGDIMHTDRGSQYCSNEHRALLDAHGLIATMSARGNCYDNAAMESWNHSLKVEAIHGERFTTREQAHATSLVPPSFSFDIEKERTVAKVTGATQIAAKQFLDITYPTHDLLKGIEAIGLNQGRPVVVIGERGLGKSHLMAAFYHAVTNPVSTGAWLNA